MGNYLYNGVELPQLPEWDKTIRPYAVVVFNSTDNSYYFGARSEPLNAFDGGWCTSSMQLNDEHILTDGEWVEISYFTGTVIWANHNVYIDDTLYLAASEPVPVNPTVPKVSPQLAFTIGKQLGRRIFR